MAADNNNLKSPQANLTGPTLSTDGPDLLEAAKKLDEFSHLVDAYGGPSVVRQLLDYLEE